MAQDAAIHIKLDQKTDQILNRLAYTRKTSKGQLVREAVTACYQTSIEHLTLPQQQALAAFQGGYISMNKLAGIMGLHVLDMRRWLDEHGIAFPSALSDQDARNA